MLCAILGEIGRKTKTSRTHGLKKYVLPSPSPMTARSMSRKRMRPWMMPIALSAILSEIGGKRRKIRDMRSQNALCVTFTLTFDSEVNVVKTDDNLVDATSCIFSEIGRKPKEKS